MKKISDYITKKVADKLSGMCKTDRENYEKYWDDINPFIKFGCLKDEKFAEKMNDYIIFKNLDGKYLTLKDCLEANKEKAMKTQVFYVTDEKEQSQYINMFKEARPGCGDPSHMPSIPRSSPIVEQKNEKREVPADRRGCQRDLQGEGRGRRGRKGAGEEGRREPCRDL